MPISQARARAIAAVVAACLLSVVAAWPADGRADVATWHRISLDSTATAQAVVEQLASDGGVEPLPSPPRGYVAWLTPTAARRVANMRGVASVAPLRYKDKVSEWNHNHDVLVATVHGPTRHDAVAELATVGRVFGGYPSPDDLHNIAVSGRVSRIARNRHVLAVGPAPLALVPLDEMSDQIVAAAGKNAGAAPGYEGWLAARGVDGSGVRIAVVDSGIDPHPDLRDRIVAKEDLSVSPTGEPVDLGGHGTHVAGIVAGSPTTLPGTGRIKDEEGFLLGQGVAPRAELVDVNSAAVSAGNLICEPGAGWRPPGGWSQLTEAATRNGAFIWNASWKTCEGAGVGYVEGTRAMDFLVRDAEPRSPGNTQFTMVFAAGNKGGAERTIEAPAEAKNVITVGATRNRRAGSPDEIAEFSSRGPARDGRIEPTIVAPGERIVSTRAAAGAFCNEPRSDGFGLYSECSGTSMAAPHVSGAVGLITQRWRAMTRCCDPSPALTKALLVNSAQDVGEPDVPNNHEGWGRMDLTALFDRTLTGHAADQKTVFDHEGAREAVQFSVSRRSLLKATLVWTDAPATLNADPALVNDLDLVVTAPDGTQYKGNFFDRGVSVPGGTSDRLNNVENVIADAAPGAYRVEVTAHRLLGDGVPDDGDETDQDFALVIAAH